jgi:hypothetical protein
MPDPEDELLDMLDEVDDVGPTEEPAVVDDTDDIDPDDGLDPSMNQDTPAVSAGIGQFLSKFDTISNQLMEDYEEDRSEVNALIADLRVKIDGGVLKEYFFTTLASFVATKSTSTANAMKQMDAIAKIIAATKNHDGLANGKSPALDALLGD